MTSRVPQVCFLSSPHAQTRKANGLRRRIVSRLQRQLAPGGHSHSQEDSIQPSASARIKMIVLVDTVPFCRPVRLLSSKEETPAETVNFKRARDIDSEGSAARQAALFRLQALCRREIVPSPTTVSVALF